MKLIEAKQAKEFASTFLADKILQAAVNAVLDNCPTADAVVLPKGKPGDYVLWTNGVSERLFAIYSLMICEDGIRYDLGDLSPFVNHSNILKIMNQEEAERWIENVKREATD